MVDDGITGTIIKRPGFQKKIAAIKAGYISAVFVKDLFNQGNHGIKFFGCRNHNSGLRKCSSTHYIRLDFLEKVVLYEVHRLACFANENENDFIKAMVGRSAKVEENDRVRKKRELDGLLAWDKELDMLFERLYEDNVSGKIDDARFAKMSKRYEQE